MRRIFRIMVGFDQRFDKIHILAVGAGQIDADIVQTAIIFGAVNNRAPHFNLLLI